jgi:hypothetical protein
MKRMRKNVAALRTCERMSQSWSNSGRWSMSRFMAGTWSRSYSRSWAIFFSRS